MKALCSILLAGLLLTIAGCGESKTTTKPATFAPPPDPKEAKGDTAPGPP
jgi:hypothetical protein